MDELQEARARNLARHALARRGPPRRDIPIGSKFGEWTVLHQGGESGLHVLWICECSCGEIRPVRSDTLLQGRSLRCHPGRHGITRGPNKRKGSAAAPALGLSCQQAGTATAGSLPGLSLQNGEHPRVEVLD